MVLEKDKKIYELELNIDKLKKIILKYDEDYKIFEKYSTENESLKDLLKLTVAPAALLACVIDTSEVAWSLTVPSPKDIDCLLISLKPLLVEPS